MFEVSQSGYYDSLSRTPSQRELRNEALKKAITEVFHRHKGRYGRTRIWYELKSLGLSVSEKLVGKLMHSLGLFARRRKRFRPKTTQVDRRAKYSKNHLKGMSPDAPNQVLVTDITYLPTKEGWLYLSGVMDLYSKKIKGYALSDSLQTSFCLRALHSAVNSYPKLKGALHHSDRGIQYTSRAYQNQLRDFQMKSSMSAQGYCYDNAAMESFWATLKAELLPESKVFQTKREAAQAVFEYIQAYYNTIRRHSSLGYLSPLQFEQLHAS